MSHFIFFLFYLFLFFIFVSKNVNKTRFDFELDKVVLLAHPVLVSLVFDASGHGIGRMINIPGASVTFISRHRLDLLNLLEFEIQVQMTIKLEGAIVPITLGRLIDLSNYQIFTLLRNSVAYLHLKRVLDNSESSAEREKLAKL